MRMLKAIDEFIFRAKKENVIIYGAGWVGQLVYKFLKYRKIPVTAFAVTALERDEELDEIPVYCIDNFLRRYGGKGNIFLAVRNIYYKEIEEELARRNISDYFIISEKLQYEMMKELLRFEAKSVEFEKKNKMRGITIGYLSTDYLGSDYAQKRLIIDKVNDTSYIEIPWETENISFSDTGMENDVIANRQMLEACYTPCEYMPKVDAIHTFNAVCNTHIPWWSSFETTIPRMWPRTDNEKEYYLKLIGYLKKPECRRLYALCQNAYEIQRHTLMPYVSKEDLDLLMDKTRVLHPPQCVLVTEREFEHKHRDNSIHFIFIGRQFFFKGGREVVQVLSEWKKKYDFKFTLISALGYDDYFTKTSYEEMIRCKKMIESQSWIDYYPSLPNFEVLQKCKEATIGLLPSVADTYGYAVLEMQAAGCPVITTNIRAFPEINNEECGWICNIPINEIGVCSERNSTIWSRILSNGLNQCFQEIFDNPEKIKEKGRKALERIKKMHDPYTYQSELGRNLYKS